MPMNRVQFQPGLSRREFWSLYGTDELCEAALIARRWPRGFECPRCGVCEARTSFARQGGQCHRGLGHGFPVARSGLRGLAAPEYRTQKESKR